MFLFTTLLGCAGSPPVERMAPCPTSPNCVTSVAPADERHAVAPFPVEAWEPLGATLRNRDDVQLVVDEPDYRHYTFTTRWMGFVDDVELSRTADAVHVRSASRLGRSDLGVNRARIDALRATLVRD
jgi:uncharacterized protein (DUF1499 family)